MLIIGGDQALLLARILEYSFIMLRLPATSPTTPGQTIHGARAATKKDLVFAISFGRGLRQTVEGLKEARQRKAHCVGITDTSVSPIARYSDEFFVVSVEGPSFFESYAGPIALINSIVVSCTEYRPFYATRILKEAEKEQETGLRWYSEP
jgi:DNA-binding MurR/RpiR family transcriptional regulator